MKTVFFILALTLQTTTIFAQRNVGDFLQLQSKPEIYFVQKAQTAIEIDGKDDEISWAKAAWTNPFKDIEGNSKPKPELETRVKMLWDNENLYLFAKLEETHIKGYLRQKDTIIYHDNDFEVFLKPNLQSPEYIEIEVNALNTIMDLLMTKPYRFGGKANLNWDTKDIQSAVYHAGTINNPTDIDNFWTVEMKIPVKSLKYFGEGNQIKANEMWKINFSRVQWHYDIHEKGYSKRKDNTGKPLAEENWVWSPIGLINMHYPERWGHIKFVDQDDQQFVDEQFLALEKTVWNIFYLQQIYGNVNKRFATSLDELSKLYPEIINICKHYQLVFSNANKFYRVEIKSKSQPNLKATIDNQGNIYF
ncbi:hypothetical protein D7322_26495 [Sphingobacterium puteale]|uniref:Carbohydrate-binding domain-containing protein n=1 Tax=Sphingobacterium puteale TaxID=2420510 RepID=A0A420VQL6_9SPHI|nr:carbohydrate-binding family 9-like protein [Sphingobacterium puteale]RKO68609.1 hypothetical protein D7322_26495 [Sphingobacterium puteale]